MTTKAEQSESLYADALDQIRTARKLISEHGWIKGQMGSPETGFCAMGALQYALDSVEQPRDLMSDVIAQDQLEYALPRDHPALDPDWDIRLAEELRWARGGEIGVGLGDLALALEEAAALAGDGVTLAPMARYNDWPGVTEEDVLQVMDRAAESIEKIIHQGKAQHLETEGGDE